jgi:hypothetical protein
MPFILSFLQTKITSFDLENPLGFNADGTISIPKEVILRGLCRVERHPRTLLALNRSLCRSESRRGLISADKNRFLPAGFAIDSRSFCAGAIREKPHQAHAKTPYSHCSAFLPKSQEII